MKPILVFLSLLAIPVSAFADFPAPPPLTALHCVKDARGADGPYVELLVHRVGQGPYEVVRWNSYVPEGQIWATGVKRTVLAAETNCSRSYTGFGAYCNGNGFELKVTRVDNYPIGKVGETHYDVEYSGGTKLTFGNSAFPRAFCEILD